MPRTDLLLGRFDRADPLGKSASGDLLLATPPDGESVVLLLPADPRLVGREREASAEVAGPGVAGLQPVRDTVSGRSAFILDVPPDARCLASWSDLPPATLREGLVALLTVLSRSHQRGRVHRHVGPESILATPAGDFWLTGWGASCRVADAPERGGFSAVALDVRDLGAAFVAALRRCGDATAPKDLSGLGASVDFRRVLSRLLAPDPRDAYSTASEVLDDLGHPDTLDPWRLSPYVERGDSLRRILHAFESAQSMDACAVAEVVGPSGSGRSRLLAFAASTLRARGAIVLAAEASGCAWGGLASIARQLTQMVGRESEAWRTHAAALEPVVSHSGEPTDGGVLPSATALTALLVEAFERCRGAIVLDDEDQMPANAAETWRSLRRQAIAALGGRALFLSSRTGPSGEADAAKREVVELGDWSPRELQQFLEGVLSSPGLAADAAPILRDAAGGRPAEIVGILRDLERSGFLTRGGARWRLDVPLHKLPDFTPADGEVVRRALRVAGRDATALAEVLAVAGQPLQRDDCGKLAELPGPRLWQAAERAEEAGLLQRDGSSWRLRSAHIRGRVLAALPPTRRRSLHREMLGLLRAMDPDSSAEQARHARAAGHPDAGTLTRTAVDQLSKGGYFDSAIAQLIDAENTLGEPEWGRRAWAERIQLLRFAGRLGEGLELADRLLTHRETTAAERADALVRRIRVLYESRDWDAVLAQELPEEIASPEQLAILRYMRASALWPLGRGERAEREARLASAEARAVAASTEVRRARQEYLYKAGYHQRRYDDAAAALLARLRTARAEGRLQEYAHDLVRLGGVHRVEQRFGRASAVLRRAMSACDNVPEGARHVRGSVINTAALVNTSLDQTQAAEAQLRFAALYEQTSAPVLVSTARVRRIFSRVATQGYDSADHRSLREIVERIDAARDSEILAWGSALAYPLEVLGYQPAVECFSRRSAALGARVSRVRAVLGAAVRGRLRWSSPPVRITGAPWQVIDSYFDEEVGRRLCDEHAMPPSVSQQGLQEVTDSVWALCVAWELRTGGDLGLAAIKGWDVDQACRRLRVRAADGGTLGLALALGLWHPERLSAATWSWIRWLRAAYDGSWYPSLRWQAHLLDSKLHWRAGRIPDAAESARQAVDQARWLLSDRFGVWGERECAFALRAIVARAPVGALDGLDLESPSPRAVRPAQPVARAARPLATDRALVLEAPSAAALVHHLAGVLDTPVARTLHPGLHQLGAATVVFLPELHAAAELRRSFEAVGAARSSKCSVLICTSLRADEVAGSSAGVRLLFEAASARRIVLDSVGSSARERLDQFVAALRRRRAGLRISPAARAELSTYGWPGGSTEVERVAAAAAALAATEVTTRVLGDAGLELRAGLAPHLDPATHSLLRQFDGGAERSIAELARATGLARRTLQRRLMGLVTDGVLERRGKGRASRYGSGTSQA